MDINGIEISTRRIRIAKKEYEERKKKAAETYKKMQEAAKAEFEIKLKMSQAQGSSATPLNASIGTLMSTP